MPVKLFGHWTCKRLGYKIIDKISFISAVPNIVIIKVKVLSSFKVAKYTTLITTATKLSECNFLNDLRNY